MAPALVGGMPEVTTSAEEAGEEVEGVVVLAAGAALLAVLGEAFVAVLVVDTAGGGVREGVVGISYGDKFLFGGFVASGGGGLLVGVIGGSGGELRAWLRPRGRGSFDIILQKGGG